MTLSYFRSLAWADYFINALVDPRNLFRIFARKDAKPFGMSFIIPALLAITEILSISLLGSESSFFYYKISYGWILFFLIIILKLIISASLMDMIAQFFGFNGRIKELVSILNYSLLPGVFLLPIIYIFKIMNFAPLFFYFLFTLLLTIWSAFIAIQGISEMHSTGFGRALFIYLFPSIFALLFTFFIIILLIISGVGFFFG